MTQPPADVLQRFDRRNDRARPLEMLIHELYAAVSDQDWTLELVVGSDCAWSCEVRIVVDPNRLGPDRSLVTFAAGGASAEAVAGEAVDDLLRWLKSQRR